MTSIGGRPGPWSGLLIFAELSVESSSLVDGWLLMHGPAAVIGIIGHLMSFQSIARPLITCAATAMNAIHHNII
jgi:hypothetical protein